MMVLPAGTRVVVLFVAGVLLLAARFSEVHASNYVPSYTYLGYFSPGEQHQEMFPLIDIMDHAYECGSHYLDYSKRFKWFKFYGSGEAMYINTACTTDDSQLMMFNNYNTEVGECWFCDDWYWYFFGYPILQHKAKLEFTSELNQWYYVLVTTPSDSMGILSISSGSEMYLSCNDVLGCNSAIVIPMNSRKGASVTVDDLQYEMSCTTGEGESVSRRYGRHFAFVVRFLLLFVCLAAVRWFFVAADGCLCMCLLQGTGDYVTLSTKCSSTDTLLQVFDSCSTSASWCWWDDDYYSALQGQSRLFMQTQAGRTYYVFVSVDAPQTTAPEWADNEDDWAQYVQLAVTAGDSSPACPSPVAHTTYFIDDYFPYFQTTSSDDLVGSITCGGHSFGKYGRWFAVRGGGHATNVSSMCTEIRTRIGLFYDGDPSIGICHFDGIWADKPDWFDHTARFPIIEWVGVLNEVYWILVSGNDTEKPLIQVQTDHYSLSDCFDMCEQVEWIRRPDDDEVQEITTMMPRHSNVHYGTTDYGCTGVWYKFDMKTYTAGETEYRTECSEWTGFTSLMIGGYCRTQDAWKYTAPTSDAVLVRQTYSGWQYYLFFGSTACTRDYYVNRLSIVGENQAAGFSCDYTFKMENADLVNELNAIIVRFNYPTNMAMSLDCGGFFTPATLVDLGQGCSCYWNDRLHMRIEFGSNALLMPGDSLVALAGSGAGQIIQSQKAGNPYLTGSTMLHDAIHPIKPAARIEGPDLVSQCNVLSVRADGCTGSGGRPLTYQWEANGAPFVTSEPLLTLTPAQMFPATFISLELRVENFMSESSDPFVKTVSRTASMVPSINLVLGTDLVMTTRSVGLTLEALVDYPSCAEDGGVSYEWSIVFGELFELDPRTRYTNALHIPRNTLEVFHTYYFQLKVTVAAGASATAIQKVLVDHSELVARVEGGQLRTVAAGYEFTMDGSKSYDPDMDDDELKYSWSCFDPASANGTCYDVLGDPLLIERVPIPSIRPLAVSPELTFTLGVTKPGRSASATVSVAVVSNPPLYVSISSIAGTLVPRTSHVRLLGVLDLPTSLSRNFSELELEWSVTPVIPLDLTTCLTVPGTRTLVVKPNVLDVSVTYTFRLTASIPGLTSGYAEQSVTIVHPPWGGQCSVVPPVGYALATQFLVFCFGFQTESGELSSMKYSFRYEVQPAAANGTEAVATNVEIPLAPTQSRPYMYLRLPGASHVGNSSVIVRSYVYDDMGALTTAESPVTVMPYTDKSAAIGLLDDAMQIGNNQAVMQLVCAIVSVLDEGEYSSAETLDLVDKIVNTLYDTLLSMHITLEDITQQSVCLAQVLTVQGNVPQRTQLTVMRVVDHLVAATFDEGVTSEALQGLVDIMSVIVERMSRSETLVGDGQLVGIMLRSALEALSANSLAHGTCGEIPFSVSAKMLSVKFFSDYALTMPTTIVVPGDAVNGTQPPLDASWQPLDFNGTTFELPEGAFYSDVPVGWQQPDGNRCIWGTMLSYGRNPYISETGGEVFSRIASLSFGLDGAAFGVSNMPGILIYIATPPVSPSSNETGDGDGDGDESNPDLESGVADGAVCAYYSAKYGWSTEGCSLRTDLSTRLYMVCECNHLTDFAVMMKTDSGASFNWLWIVVPVGAVLCFLFVVVIIFIAVQAVLALATAASAAGGAGGTSTLGGGTVGGLVRRLRKGKEQAALDKEFGDVQESEPLRDHASSFASSVPSSAPPMRSAPLSPLAASAMVDPEPEPMGRRVSRPMGRAPAPPPSWRPPSSGPPSAGPPSYGPPSSGPPSAPPSRRPPSVGGPPSRAPPSARMSRPSRPPPSIRDSGEHRPSQIVCVTGGLQGREMRVMSGQWAP